MILKDGVEENAEPKQLPRSAGFEISILKSNEGSDHTPANFMARPPAV